MLDAFKNKIHYIFSILLLSFIWAGCNKQELPVKAEPSAFGVEVENGASSFPATGGTGNIVISTKTNGWWVTMPSNNWCVITKTYGSGDFKLPVTIKPNDSGSSREIIVTLHSTFDVPPVDIKLTQSN